MKPRCGRRRTLIRLSLALIASAVMFELGLRLLLFTDIGGRLGAGLRDPSSFAQRWSDEYWKLKYIFTDPTRRVSQPAQRPFPPTRNDPLVGWTRRRVELGTYDHVDHARLAGRRPVLLYGDSFAACVTPPSECWEGLMAGSELADRFALINYGTGAFGLDQTYLLLRSSIGLYEGLDPIVVVSLLVDVNLDRSVLAFREWPKPHLSVDDTGKLVLDGPVLADSDAYLESHPIGIASYAWRYLVHGTRLFPDSWRGEERTAERTRLLNGRILAAIQEELEGRGLEYFVLVFHGLKHMSSETTTDWREPFLLDQLDRLGMPYISSRLLLEADAERTGRPVGAYFYTRANARAGMGRRHYTPLGNQVVFEAFRRGIAQRFDGGSG